MPEVTVTVADDHIPALPEVADALRARGMRVAQVLSEGFVVGSIRDGREDDLRAVEGVQSVDPALRHQLPPPSSSVQ